MVRLRMSRFGAKKQPSYRILATDRRNARDGTNLELLGHFNPRTEPVTLKLDLARVDYWLSVGAQPSDTVRSLIEKARALQAG